MAGPFWHGWRLAAAVVFIIFISCFGQQHAQDNGMHMGSSGEGLAPTVSVVFITKRPGGYDVLFNCLKKQTSSDWELIAVDDYGQHRKDTVLEMARRMNIPMRAFIPSKPKDRGNKFGQFNAINTGAMIASGKLIVILQDNIWLPDDFIARTIDFYRTHPETDLLGYPEQRYDTPKEVLTRDKLHEPSAVVVFDPPLNAPPSSLGWEPIPEYLTMTHDCISAMGKPGDPFVTDWFECAACTVPWEVLSRLNGLDEILDKGDDAQESNIKDRAQLLGWEVWDMPDVVIELIDHHRWEHDDEWTRFEGDTNIHRWRALKDKMALGEYVFDSPNSYNFTETRSMMHPDLATSGVPSWDSEHPLTDMSWSEHLPPNRALNATVQSWIDAAMKDTNVFKPQFMLVYSMPREEEEKWHDGLSSAIYLLRRHFHINPFNIYGWQLPSPGTWNVKIKNVYHFMIGIGELGGTADTFLRLYNEHDPGPNGPGNDGTPTKKGFIVTHGGGKTKHIKDLYKVVFYPTPWHESRLKKSHHNARHALGVNANFFSAQPPAPFVHNVPCPPLFDSKSFCNDGGKSDPEYAPRFQQYDYVVVGAVSPKTRLDLLFEKEGSKLVLGTIDPECDSCNELADRLIDEDVTLFSNPLEAEDRARLLRSHSRVCFFPHHGDGGGEAALLEARAVGCKIEIADNPRLESLLDTPIWDQHYYADQLQRGIWSALNPNSGY